MDVIESDKSYRLHRSMVVDLTISAARRAQWVSLNRTRDCEYQVTGVIEQSHDFQTDDGSGVQHAGCEILVVVEEQRVHITTSGWARDFPPSAHITASGRWSVVAAYEWDEFQVPDVRTDWLVRSIANVGCGDLMLDLVTLPSSTE